jgi:hypothetical protein
MRARRTYYPIVLERTLEFCEQLRKRGAGAVDAQNAMQRLSLDVIMVAAFRVDPRAIDFEECEILDSLHYCFEEIFRCWFARTCFPTCVAPAITECKPQMHALLASMLVSMPSVGRLGFSFPGRTFRELLTGPACGGMHAAAMRSTPPANPALGGRTVALADTTLRCRLRHPCAAGRERQDGACGTASGFGF